MGDRPQNTLNSRLKWLQSILPNIALIAFTLKNVSDNILCASCILSVFIYWVGDWESPEKMTEVPTGHIHRARQIGNRCICPKISVEIFDRCS